MYQWLALDRRGRRSYYAAAAVAVIGVLGCAMGFEPIAPAGLPPVPRSDAERWVAQQTPTRGSEYKLRWTYKTPDGSAKGRAAVRFAPPDSVRFDFRAPFGKSGAAMIVGDTVLWAKPEDDASDLIQTAALFWAALGIPRPPDPEAAITGSGEGARQIWRFATGGDTLTYVIERTARPLLRAELRSGGKAVGQVEVQLGAAGWNPVSARMRLAATRSSVLFTVEAIDTLATFDPGIWRQP